MANVNFFIDHLTVIFPCLVGKRLTFQVIFRVFLIQCEHTFEIAVRVFPGSACTDRFLCYFDRCRSGELDIFSLKRAFPRHTLPYAAEYFERRLEDTGKYPGTRPFTGLFTGHTASLQSQYARS
jgi:hypothetical protein